MSPFLKSKITKVGVIDYDKKFNLDQIFADNKALEVHIQRLKNVFKNPSDEFIRLQLDNIVMRENAFNAIMEYLATLFKIDFDQEDVNKFANQLKPQFPHLDEKAILEVSKKMITKALIFGQLAIENNIKINDDEAKQYLENYYKTTNNSINEFLNNQQKFEEIKSMILEEKITGWVIDKFKVYVDVKILLGRQVPVNNSQQPNNPINPAGTPNINK